MIKLLVSDKIFHQMKFHAKQFKQCYLNQYMAAELIVYLIRNFWIHSSIIYSDQRTLILISHLQLHLIHQRLAKCRPIDAMTENGVDEIVKQNFWLGGFFSPEAFITAFRQYVAHVNMLPLDQLQLVVQIGDSVPSTNAFVFSGLTLEGAIWKNNSLQLANDDADWCSLPLTAIRWELPNRSLLSNEGNAQKQLKNTNIVSLPVYLNNDRKVLLVSVTLESSPSYVYSEAIWSQRCVALSAWNQSFTY
jgi:hypothetical protein